MRRQLTEISNELDATKTIVSLARVFEAIASTKIAQIKDQTQMSQLFFAALWQIYTQIRVSKEFHFGRSQVGQVINKELMILITSEGALSGDIDQRLIKQALKTYNPGSNDILVIGRHGAQQLMQAKVGFIRSFKLPEHEQDINVMPVVGEAQKYASTIVYYQSYVSLMTQEIKTIKLSAAVAELGASVEPAAEVITEGDYIFEPSPRAVIEHLERSMMQIALSEVILESRLAQHASRFRAMSLAHEKGDDLLEDLNWTYFRAKRRHKDERFKEIINGLRKTADL